MDSPNPADIIRTKYQAIQPHLDERARRCWAGTEALALGHGGVSLVAAATGISPRTIRVGMAEIRAQGVVP